MKVDNPIFKSNGEVGCRQCPLDEHEELCALWIAHHNVTCPTAENYADACKGAES